MRKLIVLAFAAATIFSASFLVSGRADAMTLGTPSGLLAAIEDSQIVPAHYRVCRWSPRWGTRCWWRGGGHYSYRPYYYPRRYYWNRYWW